MPLEPFYFVTGATGAQGGAVARALLDAGKRVRALTRRPSSPAAQSLRALGAELIEGDLSDRWLLQRQLEGAAGLFAVTNFWEHFGTETAHGKNLVDAALSAGVPHTVLSSLPSSTELSEGELSVAHFETKATVERYARERGLVASYLHVAFYYQNFLDYFAPRPDERGRLGFAFPQGDTPLAGVDVEDVGPVVRAVFAAPSRFRGQVVGVVGEDLTGHEYAMGLSWALGCAVRYDHVEAAEYAQWPFPGAAELAAMFDLNRRFIRDRSADAARSRQLHPGMTRFVDWARRNREPLLRAVRAA